MSNSNVVPTPHAATKLIKLSLLGLLGSVLNISPLHAGVIFTFSEVGNDVVATTSGSIDNGWSAGGKLIVGAGDQGELYQDRILAKKEGGEWFYDVNQAWTRNNDLVGVEGLIKKGGVSGDNFGYQGNGNFYAPEGTNSGDAFTPNTTITWANETFSTLGLDTALSTTPLTLFTLDNGSTISAVRTSGGGAAVPEPSSLAMLGCGAVVASGYRRLRSKKKKM